MFEYTSYLAHPISASEKPITMSNVPSPRRPVTYRARLSIADQVAPVSHTNVTIPVPSDDIPTTVGILRDGFRRYVRQLPYLTGHIRRSNQRGYTMIEWNDDTEFVLEEKYPNGLPHFNDLLERKMPLHELNHDFRPSGIITREYVEQPGDRWPAMKACITYLDGGIVIGCSYHHHLCDGMATQVLVHRLGLVVSGGIMVDVDAELDSLAPLRRFQQINRALEIETSETGAIDEPLSDAPRPSIPPSPGPAAVSTGKEVETAVRIFTINLAALEILRISLRESLREDFDGRRPPTSAVLASLMWCLINQSRERQNSVSRVAGKDPVSTLIMPVPATNLFDQGGVVHSRNFIGNLITAGFAQEDVAALAENSVGEYQGLPAEFPEIVKRLTLSLMTSMDVSFIKGRLGQIFELPDVRALSSGSTLSANDLLVTSWGSMSFTGTFGPGVGRPEFVRPATEPANARKTKRAFYQYVIILPKDMHGRQGSEGTIELFVCLEKGDMADLERHPVLVKLQREPVKL